LLPACWLIVASLLADCHQSAGGLLSSRKYLKDVLFTFDKLNEV
jgi:hypothetical protein